MYRDLYDKNKERYAFITEDYKCLHLIFEFRGSALSFNKEKSINKTEEFFGGELKIELNDNKNLELEIKLKESDLDLLYKIVIIMSYILGKDIHLQYFYKNFPYYPSDHYFNLNTHSPTSNYLLRKILSNPTNTLKILLNLLTDTNSYFNKLVVGMIQVNAFPFLEFIFVYEYGLLQGLAKENHVSGKIFTKRNDPEKLKKLKGFSVLTQDLLDEKYPEISDVIKKKLDFDNLNNRGVIKDQIKIFLNQFENKRIQDYIKYLNEWNKIRNQTTIAHGINFMELTDIKIMQPITALHDLLLEIISEEVSKTIK